MGILDKVFGRDDDKDNTNKRTTGSNAASGSTGGASASRPATDRPVADFSDVNASSSSTNTTARSYTVAAGDSLSKIAQREYGDASQWRRIFEANRNTINNPDLIHPGQVLTIPSDR